MALMNYNKELESKELEKNFERLPLTKSSAKDNSKFYFGIYASHAL